MATENLTLVDNMSPALKNIARNAKMAHNELQRFQKSLAIGGNPKAGYFKGIEESLKFNRQIKTAQNNLKEFYKTLDIGSRKNYLTKPIADLKRFQSEIEKATRHGLRTGRFVQGNYGGLYRAGSGRFVDQMTLYRYGRMLEYRRQSSLSNLEGLSVGFVSGLKTASLALLGFSAVIGSSIDVVKDAIKPQEDYIGNLTRIALTSDMKRTPQAMANKIYDVAAQTRADAEGSMMLYNRIAMSGVKESNDNILRFVETFNKLTALSGTSGQENRAVMLQLAQGIGSNRLGGDEFRSIAEQAPLFKYMLAKGMGVGPGELKKMGAEGKLTARAILDAMAKVQDEVDSIFKNAPWKIEQLFTIMKVKWDQVGINNLEGYVAVRDLIKDIAFWLTMTEDGQKFLKDIWDIINSITITIVNFIRRYRVHAEWIATHIKEIVESLSWVARILLSISGLALFSKFIEQLNLLIPLTMKFGSTGLIAVKGVDGGLKTATLSAKAFSTALLGAVGIAILLGDAINAAISAWREYQASDEVIDKKANAQLRDAYINNELAKQGFGYFDESGKFRTAKWSRGKEIGGVVYNTQYAYNQARLKAKNEASQTWKSQYEKPLLEHQKEVNNARNNSLKQQQEDYYGMLASDKNKEMSVNGGYLDGIRDSVTIDNEGIEMMKTIAERQWVMQNEVVVPQQVNVTVDKSVDMNEDSIVNIVSRGIQRAAGGSLVSQGGF